MQNIYCNIQQIISIIIVFNYILSDNAWSWPEIVRQLKSYAQAGCIENYFCTKNLVICANKASHSPFAYLNACAQFYKLFVQSNGIIKKGDNELPTLCFQDYPAGNTSYYFLLQV